MRWRRLRLDLVIKLVIIIMQHILVSLHNLVMAHVTQKVQLQICTKYDTDSKSNLVSSVTLFLASYFVFSRDNF